MPLHLRPTFSLDLAEPADTVLARLRDRLAAPDLEVRWARVPGGGAVAQQDLSHVVVAMIPEARHFWSPWLQLDVQAQPNGTHVFGRFGPHPSVWTGFAFAYLVLGVVGFFATVFAFALLDIGGTSWAVGVVGACAGTAGGLWWASRIGQRLAAAQMRRVREVLDLALQPPQ